MKNVKKVKIGILGLGNVGSELVSLIKENKSKITFETNCEIEIAQVFVRSLTKKRNIDTVSLPLTTNAVEIINDPNIDIICECMGGNGSNITFNYILQALENKKHVILSSKKMLANHSATLVKAAESNKVILKYDASVGGGIPIAKVLETAFKGDDIIKIAGIFNATSNFIYSNIQYGNTGYAHALKIAQEKGFAENDPSEDVDGIDSKNKLVILSLFGMQKLIQPHYLLANSFKNIEKTDVSFANDLGYQIKPLAILKAINSHYEYYIGPCLVNANHIFAATHNNFNSIILEGAHTGDLGFYGQGAGGRPTATAMFDDLISILKNRNSETIKPLEHVQKSKLKQLRSRFYFRISNLEAAKENVVGSFHKAKMDIEQTISQKNEQIIISAEANAGQIRVLRKNIAGSGAELCKAIPIFN